MANPTVGVLEKAANSCSGSLKTSDAANCPQSHASLSRLIRHTDAPQNQASSDLIDE